MLGVTGNLLGRVQDRIEYDYGRWCGEELLGKYRWSILVLNVYNVSQTIDWGIGDSTYYKQLQSQYHQEYCRLVIKNKKKADSTVKKSLKIPSLDSTMI